MSDDERQVDVSVDLLYGVKRLLDSSNEKLGLFRIGKRGFFQLEPVMVENHCENHSQSLAFGLCFFAYDGFNKLTH